MTNTAINELYGKSYFYKNRPETDTFFALPEGSVSFKGNLDYAIRFIEDYQLMSPELWAKFVTQFRNTVPKADDHDDGWRGEYWGKMMRGACFTYSYTQNEKLYETLCDTVRDMMSTQDESGRISSYSYEKQYRGWDIWSRKYVLLGMQYFIEICKDEKFISEIVQCMRGQVDYLISTIGLESEGKILITKATSHWRGMNSSSLLEPIVRFYNITGEQKYLDFATYIVDCGVISDENISIFEIAYEDKLDPHKYPVVKAYEMMSCFEGLLEYYRVTKIEKWKTAIVNFAKRVRLTEISVIGSSGCTHELFDHTLVRQVNTLYNGVLQETCVTVTWMKFCFQLLCLTGDPCFADEIEKSTYNALMGAINFNKLEKNGGLPFDSYSPLLFNTRLRGIGGKKVMADGSFYGCCACIGAAGTGIIGKSAAMMTENGIAINTYSSGSVTYKTPDGENVTVEIETKYPLGESVTFTVQNDTSLVSEIALRIPEWSKDSTLVCKGEQVSAVAGSYAKLRRNWKKGDKFTLNLDMRCRVINATPDPKDENSAYHVALKRGPLALARDKRLKGDIESIVNFSTDETGSVPCEITDCADFEHFYSFTVTEADGSKIDMVDYASAGRTWDEESLTTVWMPTKNYWKTDLCKPLNIVSPNSWDSSDSRFSVYINESGVLAVSTDKADTFTLEKTENADHYKIKAEGKGYVKVSSDGEFLTVAEEGDNFTVKLYAQNRYKIYAPDGRALVGSNNPERKPLISLETPSFSTIQIFRFEQV